MQSLIPTLKFNNFQNFLVKDHIPPYTVLPYTISDKISFICDKNHTNTIGFGAFGNKKPRYLKNKISFFCSTCETNATKQASIVSSSISSGKIEYVSHLAADTFERSEKYYEMEKTFGLSVLSYDPQTRTVVYTCGNCKTQSSCHESSFLRKSSNACGSCSSSTFRLSFDDISSTFSSAGLRIAWTREQFAANYKDKDTPIMYICTCDSVSHIRVADVIRGSKCASCKSERTAATNMTIYGVPNVFQNEDIKQKSRATNQLNIGVDYPMQNPTILAKMKDTNIQKYGFPYAMCQPYVYEKIRSVCQSKFGVDYPFQSKDIFSKAIRAGTSLKSYTMMSGDIKLVQGYEPQCLKKLDNGLNGTILAGDTDIIPFIDYTFNNKSRKYYPDIYLPKYNLIIEVKSTWTLENWLDKNLAKASAVENSGYNCAFWVLGPKKSSIPIIYRLHQGRFVNGRMFVEDQVEGVDYCNIYD